MMNTIEKHNLFELIGQRQYVFHSAVLTCYTFDPVFFNSYFMPRLRTCGITNVIVMMDAGNYDHLLDEYPSYKLDPSSQTYTLVRQQPKSHGVFHPKIVMLIGQDAGLLFVGSGNLTYSGFSLNEEIWGAFSLNGRNSIYAPLFGKAWNYLMSVFQSKSLLMSQQIQWMLDNSSWLEHVSGITTSSDIIINDESFRFLSNVDESVLLQIATSIGRTKVNTISIVSPFYDINGDMIKALHQIFSPQQIHCVVTKDGTYPYDLISETPTWLLFYLWEDMREQEHNGCKKLHGKLMQFDTTDGTFLIIGSANATYNALNGINDEACILVHAKQNIDYFEELGIAITERNRIKPDSKESLRKPELSNKEIESLPYHISSSEIIDDKLFIYSDVADGKYVVCGISVNGNIISEKELSPESGTFVDADNNWDSVTMVVISDKEGNELSNRCFVVLDDIVGRCNPNQNLRKLESLLDSSVDWKANLMNILSYVYFDDEPREKATKMKYNNSLSRTHDYTGQTVNSEDFDNIADGSKQNIMAMPDVRIVEFLLHSTSMSKRLDDSTNRVSDDLDGVTDIDNGDSSYQYEDIIEGADSPKFEACIDYYSKRLGKFYDSRLESFYKSNKEGRNKFILQPIEERKIKVNDYSQILINVVLMWKLIMQDQTVKHDSFMKPLLHNLGQFLLLSRNGYEKRNDYAWYKMEEYHRDLVVYSLLMIAHYEWYGKAKVKAKLLVLNLMDSYRNDVPNITNTIWNAFNKEAEQAKFVLDKHSIRMIKETIEDYKIFHQHRDDKSLIRLIQYGGDGEFIYKKQYGFLYGYGFKPVKDANGMTSSIYTVSHTGFDVDYAVKGGIKVLSLPDRL